MKRAVLVPVLLSILTMFCAGGALAAQSRISLVIDRGVIFVRAGVDGSPLMLFVFDPGAQTFLTQYAQARVKHATIHALTFGPVTMDEPVQTISGDPQQLDPRHDVRLGVIAGTLGGEFLRRYVLRIDYASKTLEVLPPATFTAPKSAPLPLSIDRFGVPAVPAQADGKRGLFELDVRAPSSMLFTPLASELGYHVPQRQKERVASITIGTLTQRNIQVWISNDRDGKFASANPRGLIGNDVLSRYVLTLDYPHRRAYIEPAAHTLSRGLGFLRYSAADFVHKARAGARVNYKTSPTAGVRETARATAGGSTTAGLPVFSDCAWSRCPWSKSCAASGFCFPSRSAAPYYRGQAKAVSATAVADG